MATKIGVGGLSTTVFACFRYLTTGIVALIISIIIKGKGPQGKKEWKVLLSVALLMNFLTNGCVVLSNKYADSGLVTVLFSSVPILITVIDSLILKNYKLGVQGWLGTLGGLLGIAFITFWGSPAAKADAKGIIFALCAAVFWSIGSVYSKGKMVHGTAITHVTIEALFASSLFFITGKLTGDFSLQNITARAMAPIIYLAVVDSLIGFMSYICLLKIWKASTVSTYAYINPVVALILGALVLHEPLTFGKIIGMLIIIFCVILIQKDKVKNVACKET